ncbi:hypothetical protein ACT3S9_19960 [Pseudoalteromonas sp. AOP31-A2-14]|uniref:hypothetical protein n=1 Tax=Pseudoalteromonas sp. AOP31-A2-14 TaxID=3457695 RepID=UPI0040365CBC
MSDYVNTWGKTHYLLLRCYPIAIALLLHCYCIAIVLLLHCYCIAIALLLHCYRIAIALLLHCYRIAIALLILGFFGGITQARRRMSTNYYVIRSHSRAKGFTL